MKYMEMRQKCISSHFNRFFDVKMTSTDTLNSSSAYTCQQQSTTIAFQAILRMFHKLLFTPNQVENNKIKVAFAIGQSLV